MTLIDGILLLLAMAGVTLVLVHGEIFDKIGLRPLWEKSQFLKELLHCSMCAGTWVGAFYGVLCVWLQNTIWFYILTLPFAASGFSYFWERACILMDEKINNLISENKKKTFKFK